MGASEQVSMKFAILFALVVGMLTVIPASSIPVLREFEAIENLLPEKVLEIAKDEAKELDAGDMDKVEEEIDEEIDALSKMSEKRKAAIKAVVADANKKVSKQCKRAMKKAQHIEKKHKARKGMALKNVMLKIKKACENEVALQEASMQLLQTGQQFYGNRRSRSSNSRRSTTNWWLLYWVLN